MRSLTPFEADVLGAPEEHFYSPAEWATLDVLVQRRMFCRYRNEAGENEYALTRLGRIALACYAATKAMVVT